MALRAVSTAASGAGGTIHQSYLDNSGTPGNATSNTGRGRAAFAAAGTAVTITNNTVSATSTVLVSLNSADATLTFIKSTAPGAGSFVVTGNAAATATTVFDFVVFN